jgi:hypothetical protein
MILAVVGITVILSVIDRWCVGVKLQVRAILQANSGHHFQWHVLMYQRVKLLSDWSRGFIAPTSLNIMEFQVLRIRPVRGLVMEVRTCSHPASLVIDHCISIEYKLWLEVHGLSRHIL